MKLFFSIGRALRMALGSICVAALSSCTSGSNTTLFQSQEQEGKSLLVQKLVKNNFSTIDYATLLIFDGKSPIVLDNAALSQSLPFEDGVYGGAPFHRLDTEPQSYRIGAQSYTKMRVVIYVDPSVYSPTEFEQLAQSLKKHSGAVARAVEADKDLPKYQLAGVVYGRVENFVERFSKDRKDFYEVRPDGDVTRVQLDAHGIAGMEQRSVGGLSSVGPGRSIRITDAQETSLGALQSYKNSRGQSLPQRFKIVPTPAVKAPATKARPNSK